MADLTPTPDRPGLHVSKPSPNAPATGSAICHCGATATATGDSQVKALVEGYTANHGAAQDLFSCAGGAGWGYHLAGFQVDGCDLAARPNYPFAYHRGDALEYLDRLTTTGDIDRYTLLHASPPCQAGCALTIGTNTSQGWGGDHHDLVAPTRELLERTGLPYVIEQPNGRAAIRKDLTLCGEMFGLGVLRHRNFELGRWATARPAHPRHRGYVRGHRHGVRRDGPYVAAYGKGGGKATVPEMQTAMGITWTDVHEELTEAIPPAYTRWIGAAFSTARQEVLV